MSVVELAMFLVGFLVTAFVLDWAYLKCIHQFTERRVTYRADFTLDDWVNEWMRKHPLRDHDGIPADVQRLMEKIEIEAYIQNSLEWEMKHGLIGGAIPLSIAEMMKTPPAMEQKLFLG
ncbi:hypothetical protein ACL1FJ_00615 [Corynebacterium striatum]